VLFHSLKFDITKYALEKSDTEIFLFVNKKSSFSIFKY